MPKTTPNSVKGCLLFVVQVGEAFALLELLEEDVVMDDAEVRDVVGQAALGGQGGMRLSRVAIHADVLQTKIERTVYAFSLENAKK